MYIIELIIKIKNSILNKKNKNIQEQPEYEQCSHLFLPIDSTGRILACSKCGEIYKLKKGETNPFE